MSTLKIRGTVNQQAARRLRDSDADGELLIGGGIGRARGGGMTFPPGLTFRMAGPGHNFEADARSNGASQAIHSRLRLPNSALWLSFPALPALGRDFLAGPFFIPVVEDFCPTRSSAASATTSAAVVPHGSLLTKKILR